MNANARRVALALTLALMLSAMLASMLPTSSHAQAPHAALSVEDVSDAALLKTLPGFSSAFAIVNGTLLHYVVGGSGQPVVLLPGWPQTWWSYHKIMPALAQRHRVIVVDIRGMGMSERPAGGYDKKNMAKDVHELMQRLGHSKVHMVGHDIGAQVVYSFAANHPASTASVTLLDVPRPDEQLLTWPLLPKHGTFGDKIDEANAYAWWFAFHQVRGLPEQLLEGRVHLQHEWFFRYLAKNEQAINARDRAVYAAAYNSKDAIRAGNAWYQAFTQDIIDDKTYGKLEMPVYGIAGPGYEWLKSNLSAKAVRPQVVKLPNSGHFVAEEEPAETARLLLDFLSR